MIINLVIDWIDYELFNLTKAVRNLDLPHPAK